MEISRSGGQAAVRIEERSLPGHMRVDDGPQEGAIPRFVTGARVSEEA